MPRRSCACNLFTHAASAAHLARGCAAGGTLEKSIPSTSRPLARVSSWQLDFSQANSEHLFVKQRKGRTRLSYLPPLQVRKLVVTSPENRSPPVPSAFPAARLHFINSRAHRA